MGLKFLNCVSHTEESIVIYFLRTDTDADIDEREANAASCYKLKTSDGTILSLESKDVTYHTAIPATSIKLSRFTGIQPGDSLDVFYVQVSDESAVERLSQEVVVGQFGGNIGGNGFNNRNGDGNNVGTVDDCCEEFKEGVFERFDDVKASVKKEYDSLRLDFAQEYKNLKKGYGNLNNALNTLSFQGTAGLSRDSVATMNGDTSLILENEVRDVLHYRPRLGDAQGMLAALEQSFEKKEVRGLPTFEYIPRSYVVTTDLSGEITGAQASLYSRAKQAIDASLKLLDGLTPLAKSVDEEESEATLAIIRQRMKALTDELARPAGPRVARVNGLFRQLLGDVETLKSKDPNKQLTSENVGGRLGDLRKLYKLKNSSQRINTIAEEATFTDFLIIVDNLSCLYEDWKKNKRYFDGTKRFLGTQLVLLERYLATIAESGNEVRQALESVLIGSLEQQSLEIRFTDGTQPILIDDLLEWIETFASEEGPNLIRDGGRSAIEGELRETASVLRDTVKSVLNNGFTGGSLTELSYPIVTTTLNQLYYYLDTLVSETKKLP